MADRQHMRPSTWGTPLSFARPEITRERKSVCALVSGQYAGAGLPAHISPGPVAARRFVVSDALGRAAAHPPQPSIAAGGASRRSLPPARILPRYGLAPCSITIWGCNKGRDHEPAGPFVALFFSRHRHVSPLTALRQHAAAARLSWGRPICSGRGALAGRAGGWLRLLSKDGMFPARSPPCSRSCSHPLSAGAHCQPRRPARTRPRGGPAVTDSQRAAAPRPVAEAPHPLTP